MYQLRLNHVNITTQRADETRDFFVEVVGLAQGQRPPFKHPGHWLYAGDDAVIHISQGDRSAKNGDARGTGAIDHLAFRRSGWREVREQLDRRGLRYTLNKVPPDGDVQLFVEDPNGITVELIFAGAEVASEEKALLSPR